MKKVLIVCLTVLILIAVGTGLYNYNASKPALELVPDTYNGENPGLHDFYIKDGKVYIVGGVTIKNNTDETVEYSLYAQSEEDYKSGLITYPVMEGYDETLATNKFSIAGNETETFTVVFVGEHGGYNQKRDRLMPDIMLIYE